MSYRRTKVGRMIRRSPEDAIGRIREELAKTGGNIVWTAQIMGINVATLRRWIAKLNDGGKFQEEIEKIRGDWKDRKRRSPISTRTRKRLELPIQIETEAR